MRPMLLRCWLPCPCVSHCDFYWDRAVGQMQHPQGKFGQCGEIPQLLGGLTNECDGAISRDLATTHCTSQQPDSGSALPLIRPVA